MILEGAAYYDVESKDGEWIRILCEYGDLIIIPAGHPYRMTTTAKVCLGFGRFCRAAFFYAHIETFCAYN